MQFVITARDGRDAAAPARRLAVRPAHLEGAARLQRDGHLIAGGALLDEAGGMIGSTMYVDFPDRAALDAWLKSDPYVTGGVWLDIEVQPIRLAFGGPAAAK